MMQSTPCRTKESQNEWNVTEVAILAGTQHLKELHSNV